MPNLILIGMFVWKKLAHQVWCLFFYQPDILEKCNMQSIRVIHISAATPKMPILGPSLADTLLTFSLAPPPLPLADSQRPSKKCRTARI